MNGSQQVHFLTGRSAEQSLPEPRQGYDHAAAWIASDKDGETLIFRKFGELTARNLLYMQSEIIAIEEDFRKLDARAKGPDVELQDAAWSWEALQEQHRANEESADEYIRLIKDLRQKLKEYHEALRLQADIVKLGGVDQRVLTVSRIWFHGGELGEDGRKPYPVLGGRAKDFLDDDQDLIALKAQVNIDPLSQFLRRHWVAKEEASRDGRYRIGRYDEASITLAVNVLSILMTAILLVGAVAGFYFVNSPPAKLGMIAGFTAAFALCVSIMTNARRAEIFAATAAYAAVLVVFVSNNDLTGNPS